MSLYTKFHGAARMFRGLLREPMENARRIAGLRELGRGKDLARQWHATPRPALSRNRGSTELEKADLNPLRSYFDGVKEGPGVWKWLHYFEIYHRHLSKFIDGDVSVVEIGVYSGGSLSMWREYFGENCRIHGVDIQPECKGYEDAQTTIHIGDQSDRRFWNKFRENVPSVDVLIDDGGHAPEQQMVTLEEMLPRLRPGGVYICEDVTGVSNRFTAFVHAMADDLNSWNGTLYENQLASHVTPFQSDVHSVHLYPFVVVIEKSTIAPKTFVAPKHGTDWQPFL